MVDEGNFRESLLLDAGVGCIGGECVLPESGSGSSLLVLKSHNTHLRWSMLITLMANNCKFFILILFLCSQSITL